MGKLETADRALVGLLELVTAQRVGQCIGKVRVEVEVGIVGVDRGFGRAAGAAMTPLAGQAVTLTVAAPVTVSVVLLNPFAI